MLKLLEIDECERLAAACEKLKEAARELYRIGFADTVAAAANIDEILSCDNGEAGLLPLLQKAKSYFERPKMITAHTDQFCSVKVRDRSRLRFVGWANASGMIPAGSEAVAGYREEEFWNTDGTYKGPDFEGIFPVYAVE